MKFSRFASHHLRWGLPFAPLLIVSASAAEPTAINAPPLFSLSMPAGSDTLLGALAILSGVVLAWAKWGASWRLGRDRNLQERRKSELEVATATQRAVVQQMTEMFGQFRVEREELLSRVSRLERRVSKEEHEVRRLRNRYEALREAASRSLHQCKQTLHAKQEELRHAKRMLKIAQHSMNAARGFDPERYKDK